MTTEAVVERVARAFAPGAIGWEPFGHGHINETYVVHGPDEIVLQRLNAAVFPDVDAVMANVLTVHTHVAASILPEPVATGTGRWLVHDDGSWRAWRLVVDAAPVTVPTPRSAASAATLLGRFHVSVADLDPSRLSITLPHFHDPKRRLDALRAVIVDDPHDRARAVRDLTATAFAASPLATRAQVLERQLPTRVVHNDAKSDNVLFRDGSAVCLVDLDTVMPGQWLWDVGDLLRTAATTAAEDDVDAVVEPASYEAAVGAYREAVDDVATPAEMEAVYEAGAIVTFEQAVRFLTDWIAGDVYYRTSRPDQNLDRARAQFSLLASLPGTVTSS